MYTELQKLIKEQGYRGWRLEREGGVTYLSKFEELFNDNEIRVHIHIEFEEITILNAVRIKNYTRTYKIDGDKSEYIKEAKQICEAYKSRKKTANK